jgi:hypothetical protein
LQIPPMNRWAIFSRPLTRTEVLIPAAAFVIQGKAFTNSSISWTVL